MRSQCAIAFLLLLSCGLLVGAWVKNTVDPPAGANSSTYHDRQDFTQSGRGTHALVVPE